MTPIFAYIVHKNGVPDDTALELLTAARKIDATAPVTAIVAGQGPELDALAGELAMAFDTVWTFGHEALRYPNAELLRPLLVTALPAGAVLLMAHDTCAMDLAPGLSIRLNAAFAPDVVDIRGLKNGILDLVRQEFGGQVGSHIKADVAGGAVITLRAGSFAPAEATAAGTVLDKSAEIDLPPARRRFLELVTAAAGDVDITKEDVLVSIGRGIEAEENIELAMELAEAMGAGVACSRPLVDARWLDRARQVGTSGQTVKPKVYLACGISGSFQHVGGIKGNPFIVAINKNPKAPIFQVADVGIVADILEFLPALTKAVKDAA